MVAKHIETDFVDRGVRDIAAVCRPTLVERRGFGHRADPNAEKAEHRAHPFSISTSKKIVDRHHVHGAARQDVSDGGHGSGQCLALAGRHLDDFAFEHAKRGKELHIERGHAKRTARCLTNECQVSRDIEFAAGVDAQLVGRGGDVRIGQRARPGRMRSRPVHLSTRTRLTLLRRAPEHLPEPIRTECHSPIPTCEATAMLAHRLYQPTDGAAAFLQAEGYGRHRALFESIAVRVHGVRSEFRRRSTSSEHYHRDRHPRRS